MNKTILVVCYFALALIGLAAVALIMIFRPDATATLIQFVGTILALAASAAVTFHALGAQSKEIEVVKKQTNGANTELREENAKLTAQLLSIVGNAPGVGTPAGLAHKID